MLTRSSRDNLVFSPFSLHTALSMVYFGSPSDSETHREMARLLGMEPEHQDDYAFNILQLLQRYDGLRKTLDGTNVEFANRIFLARGFSTRADYRQLMTTFYATDLTTVDFAEAERAAQEINSWVARKTGGIINDLVSADGFSAFTRMIIVNAIYFKSNWKYQFDPSKTRTLPFRVSESLPPSPHSAMEQTGQFYSAELAELGTSVLELPYEDEDFVMLVFLPDEEGEDALRALEAAMPTIDLPTLERRMHQGKFKVQLPKFEADSRLDMNRALRQLGVHSLFDNADLSDIADPRQTGEQLVVNSVKHRAAVEVSEEGTEAAAATAIDIDIRSHRPVRTGEFIVDRPFIFMIKDRSLGVPLFMGRVVDPTGKQRLRGRERLVQEAERLIDERTGDVVGSTQHQQTEQFSDVDDDDEEEEEEEEEAEEEEIVSVDCPDEEIGYQSSTDPDAISFPCRGRETMVLEAAEAEQREVLQRRRERATELARGER